MMKLKIILFEILVISTSLNAQTKTIALKSHSGMSFSKSYKICDNFGIIRELPNEFESELELKVLQIDSIQKLSDTSYQEFSRLGAVIVITSKENINDKELTKIKEKYPTSVKIIGFDKKHKSKFKKRNNLIKNNNTNSIHWLIGIIFLLGFTFSSIQIRTKNRSFEL